MPTNHGCHSLTNLVKTGKYPPSLENTQLKNEANDLIAKHLDSTTADALPAVIEITRQNHSRILSRRRKLSQRVEFLLHLFPLAHLID